MPLKYAYLEGTNNQYKITSKGEIWSTYRRMNNGTVKKQSRQISIHQFSKTHVGPGFTIYCNGRAKGYHLLPLMVKYFNLMPPDTMHYYDLKHKDGNILNNCLSNLEWKIRSCNRIFNHYPQPFYKKGIITEKICATCGIRLSIDCFHIQKPKENHKPTYRNDCSKCLTKKNWERIKKSPESLQRVKEANKRFRKSEKGKIYYSSAVKKLMVGYRKNLAPNYVAASMRIKVADMPEELYELKKEHIKLKRLLKQV